MVRRIVIPVAADEGNVINYVAATASDCRLAKRKQLVSSLLI